MLTTNCTLILLKSQQEKAYTVINKQIIFSMQIRFSHDLKSLYTFYNILKTLIVRGLHLSSDKLNLIRVVNIIQTGILQKSHIWPHLPLASKPGKNH